jgi:integrase
MRFTDKVLAAFAPLPGAKDRMAFDTECRGLGLRATAGGAKVFIVQWTDKATGRKVREPLGAWGTLTIEKAREAARVRLGRVAAGFDAKGEREARKTADLQRRDLAAAEKREAAFTLDALIAEWARLHLATRRPRYAAEAQRALRLAFAGHLTRPAGRLSHADVLAVLDATTADGKATTARLTLAYGRSCYGWAVKRRRLSVNPFAGLPPIQGGGTTRDRVLTEGELGEVWRAALALRAPFGPMVRFLLLTLARRDEAAGMTWGELNADLSTWTQPGARVKNGKPHVVHLSAPARAVLRDMLGAPRGPLPALPPADRLVFGTPANTPLSAHSWVKRTLDAAMAAERAATAGSRKAPVPMPGWVLHDFRRSGVTWLASAGFPPHVADRLLNHVGGTISGVAAVYQRSEFQAERRAALDAWGAHVPAMGEGRPLSPMVAHLDAVRRRKRADA